MHAKHFASATADSPARVMVVAELGVNHDGQVDRAAHLVQVAAEAGADAVKLQAFHPDRLLSNQAMLAGYQKSAADDAHGLLRKLTLTFEEMRQIRMAAERAGLAFTLTPFSPPDIDDARQLGVDVVKIASPDAVNLPLLRLGAGLNAPLLVSTGTCELDELRPTADLLRDHAAGGAMLQCVSSYPTPPHAASLGGMAAMADAFELPVGYSDHTSDPSMGALAVAAGAVVIEKHLTHDPTASGPDHAASLGPAAFAEYVGRIRDALAAIGPRAKRVLPIESDVRRVSRQSLCATRDLPAGHRLTAADLTFKRPGSGIAASQLDATIGRTLKRDVVSNDLLTPEHFA